MMKIVSILVKWNNSRIFINLKIKLFKYLPHKQINYKFLVDGMRMILILMKNTMIRMNC